MARKSTKADQSKKPEQPEQPQYKLLAETFRQAILQDNRGQPIRLPPERELCTDLNVSRITIRQALEVLARDGLIHRSHSEGTVTVPAAIEQYNRLRHDRIIYVMATELREEDVLNPDDYHGRICQGILEQATHAGYLVEFRYLSIPPAGTPMDLELPERNTTLGLIFVGRTIEPIVEHCTGAGYPVLCVDYWTPDPRADCVVIDCYTEAQIATEYLLRQGHSRLFMIGNHVSRGSFRERESDAELFLAGMQRVLRLKDLPEVPSDRILFSGYSKAQAHQAAQWLLAIEPLPTAGLIFSENLCDNIIAELAAKTIRVPEDVSLITKTWESGATHKTCLKGPTKPLGEIAVDALIARVASRRAPGMRFAITSILERGRTVRQR